MKFNFSIDPDGEIDGNNSSQEHFAGKRIHSVARELGQNANDARSEEAQDNNLPAIISFKKITLKTSEIPDIAGLVNKIKACKKFSDDVLKNKEQSRFYENALKVASKPSIGVLQVTDVNTTGLEGPHIRSSDHPSTPIIAFSKGNGLSDKGTNTAGGSRGIGKNAIFTVSTLGTLFYSTLTLNRESKQETHYTQGKSVLVSHIDEKGNIRKGTGFCGDEKNNAIQGVINIPKWLKREKKGLSLFALGFDPVTNWDTELSIAALTTFFWLCQRNLL